MKITFISDTHSQHGHLTDDLVGGDVIIHSGDISSVGYKHEIEYFGKWFAKLPYKDKVFIAGNHDWGFQKRPEESIEIINGCEGVTYLQDTSIIINDVKIYGSPYQPEFYNWAFNLTGPELLNKWEEIPEDTDILITHGPPYSILDDATEDNTLLGCYHLLKRVEKVKPKIHVFGHIHGGYGYKFENGTHFINASVLDEAYRYTHKPLTIEWDPETNELEFI